MMWWRNRDGEVARDYRRAGVVALALAVFTAFIVAAVIPRMFGADAQPDGLHVAALQWNILNVFRVILTATTAWYLFGAFRKLDRRINAGLTPR